jgi:hypothetical protein
VAGASGTTAAADTTAPGRARAVGPGPHPSDVRPEELAYVCQEAARDLVGREDRPLPPTVVLPAPDATRVVMLRDLPDEDRARHAVLDRFARDEVIPGGHPAYGFVAEAELADGTDVVVVVYGAHGLAPRISAAPYAGGELGEFTDDEPLDPWAMPFLHPLQHAVEQAGEPPAPPGIPGFGNGR